MKTRMSPILALALILMAVAAPVAVAQQASGPSTASQPAGLAADSRLPAADMPQPLIIVPPGPAPGGYISSWLAEMEKLARAGVDDSVMLTFVDSAGTFNLSADQIIELRDLGVCNQVIKAMIDHDSDLLSGLLPMPTSAVASSPPQIDFTPRNDAPAVSVSLPTDASPFPANFDEGSIVARDQSQFTAVNETAENWQPVIQQRESPPAQAGISPVRAPYPVKLTDPIVVFRAAGRAPNILVVNMLR